MPNPIRDIQGVVVAGSVSPLLLDRHSRLANLEFEDLRCLADASEYQFVPPGHVLFRQGEPADAVYILLTGRVEVERHDPRDGIVDNHEVCLYSSFGDSVLVGETERRHTARATSRSILLRIPPGDLQRILTSYPEVASDWSFSILTRPRRRSWQRRSAALMRRLFAAPSAA